MNEELKSLVVEHGCDSCDWGANGRLLAVEEALTQDEAQKAPDLMSDAVIAAAADAKFRLAVIEALGHQQSAMRLAALGLALERSLMAYMLEQLEGLAEAHEGEWLDRDRRERVADEAERAYDARLEQRA